MKKDCFSAISADFPEMDAVSLQFKTFCDERRLKAPDLAKIFRISQQTVLHWRSQGIPARRQAEVVEWMAAREREEFGEPAADLPHRTLVVSPVSAGEWHAWEQAALASGQTLTDWARNGLAQLAEERGFGARPDPIGFTDPVSEDPVAEESGKGHPTPRGTNVENAPFGKASPVDSSSEVA